MQAPKPSSENLSPSLNGRESTGNPYFRMLRRALADRRETTENQLRTRFHAVAEAERTDNVESFPRQRLRRGINLYARDRAALRWMVAERPESERARRSFDEIFDEILDDQLRTARWVARRLTIDYDLILAVPDDTLDEVEDLLTRNGLDLLLESDRTSFRHRESELPLGEAHGASVPPDEDEPTDAARRRTEEQRQLALANALVPVPPAERQVAEAILADPGASEAELAEACSVAEATFRKRFSRLLKRLKA